MIYGYLARDGQEIEVDRPIGKAPQCVKRNGKLYRRVYSTAAPICNEFVMGRRPSRSSQLPPYYGYLSHNGVWKRRLNALGLDDCKESRKFARDQGLAPHAKDFIEEGRRNASRAGRGDRFDKKGKPLAATKRGVMEHLETAKRVGDVVDWD
jgi:hypothetical protein